VEIERILDHFIRAGHEMKTCQWVGWTENDDQLTPGVVATLIMRWWCRHRIDRFDAWLAKTQGGKDLVEPIKTGVHAIVSSAVGLPAKPKPEDQLQAFVAEHIWFFLSVATETEEDVVRIEGPSLDVTDPGGDGLVIHDQAAPDSWQFRLWEIKKHTGGAHVSSTLRKAYQQLDRRGIQYLNKYSLIGEYLDDPQLARFYALLPDYWIERSHFAAAGVAVAVNTPLPVRSFQGFVRLFPEFADPPRLRGLLAAFDDFPKFARDVRRDLWSGL
jgi:hypothetical protein